MKNRSKILLVGNGPSVTEYEYGTSIDSYDIVVRFNWFHIDGFEKYVGTKTDIWATTVMDKQRSLKKYNKVIYHSWDKNVDKNEKYLKFKSQFSFFDKLEYPSLVDEIQNYTNFENKKYRAYSTGALVIWYFLKEYKTVDIVGFDWWDKSEDDQHHYGDAQRVGKIHKPAIEYFFIKKLIADGFVYNLNYKK